jgi:hypothetical protein
MLAQVAVVVPLASSRPFEKIWTAGTSSNRTVSPKCAPRCVLRCHSSRAGLGRHPVRSGCAPPVPPFGIQITKLSALRGSSDQVVRPSGFRSPSCPPFGVRQTKLSALRDSDPQVVRPSGFVRFLSCPPFGIQITKLSALRGSSDHQVVRPSGFRSPSCPPFRIPGVRGVLTCLPSVARGASSAALAPPPHALPLLHAHSEILE